VIGRVYFDGVDVTRKVFRRGIGNLTAETQDEEGAQTMGSVKLLFNNMVGYFNNFSDAIDPIPVEVWVGSHRLFKGTTDTENSVLNPDTETFSCECTSEDRGWLDRMKNLQMSESAGDVNRTFLEIPSEYNPGGSPVNLNVQGRWFWSLKSLIENLTDPPIPVSVQISGLDLNQYFVGGRGWSLTVQLPNMTAAGLVKETSALFNAMYYMDNGTLIMRDRKSFIESSDAPLDLPVIRGSVKQSTRRCGLDRVKFIFANTNERDGLYQAPTYGRNTIVRDPSGVTFPANKEIKSSFLQAANGDRVRLAQPQAFISLVNDDNESLYLVTNASLAIPGGFSGAANLRVDTSRALSWYECEFRGLMEWEAKYSVMDNEAALAQLIMPLRTIVHPLRRRTINLIRSVQIDLDNEIASVKGLEFKL
jgi:hypothetical protein